jgi:hypothetical protein
MSTSASRNVLTILFALFLNAAQAGPTEDLKISQLEQDVRELQRVVQQQNRRIDALESSARASRADRTTPTGAATPPATRDPPTKIEWLQSANWDTVRIGMSEAEVLKSLGPPTTTRTSDDGMRTLFYTLELEAGGFLSGRVLMRAERVLEIHRPSLR